MFHRVTIEVVNNISCSENETSIEEEPPTLFEYITEFYCIGLICLIGIIANTISIIVMKKDRERSEALLLLRVLAIADEFYLLLAIFRYPMRHMVDIALFTKMQLLVFPLLKVAQSIAILMMVFVTIDRYIYVCMPLRAKDLLDKRKRCSIAFGIFLFGFAFNIPRFLDTSIIQFVDPCGNYMRQVQGYRYPFNQPLYFDLYKSAFYMIILYIIPLSILICINCKLIIAIHRSRKRHLPYNRHPLHPHHPPQNHSSTDYNATLVLVIVVVVFIVCETPELALRLYSTIFRSQVEKWERIDIGKHASFARVCEMLLVINSSVNFFIYCIFGKRFRHILKETLQYRPRASQQITHESVPLQQQLYRG